MLSENQKRFIRYELGLMTITAAFSTRDKEFKIYKDQISYNQRKAAKKEIRKIISEIENKYVPMLSPEAHVKHIEAVATDITKHLGQHLKGNRFRIGIAQKLINMHLKYLWCSNIISEPPHCPIDGIIRNEAKKEQPEFNYNWIKSDSIDEYKSAIISLGDIARKKGESIAQWELQEFRRRDDY